MRMKKAFRNLKLNQKFTLAVMVIVVVPMIAFSIFLYRNISGNIIWQAKTENANRVKENYSNMQSIIEFSNMSVQSFINNQGLKDMLVRLKNDEVISAKDYLEFDRNDIAMLERLVNSNPYLYQVRVYAYNDGFPEMMPVLYHGSRLLEVPWGENYEPGKWQIDYPDTVMKDFAVNTSDHLMALVQEVTDDYGNPIGVVEAAVSMDTFFPELYEAKAGSWACFVSADGKVHDNGTDGQEWQPDEEVLEAVLKGEASGKGFLAEYVKAGGDDMIVVCQPVKELSGTYIQITSMKTEMNRLSRQRNLLIAVLLVIFVCLAFAVNGVVKALLKKFYEMLSVVRKVQEGDLEQRVYEPGRDEMGEMSTQFNKMLDRISVLMAENVNREVLIKNTEIKALQNQINAHFIYNVLEAVKMMAEIKEEYEISDSVTALGELLRYGMKWTSSDVTIRQEMEYIKNYIQLMNLRYDFAILLSIRIPDYIYEQQVPKMSLQPIVENAIIHGIEETENDATIYIKAVCRDEDYEIEITDSGQGMDENQVELLKKKVSGEIEVSGGSGNGIGLKNVQDRIHIRFGESFGLHFASKEGCFTKVSIRLPYTHREAEGNLNGSHENGLFHER